jgi:soluble lytic murein transglycosylase-like protein
MAEVSMKGPRLAGICLLLAGAALSAAEVPQSPGRRTYDPVVRKVAKRHGIEADLIHAIIRAESNYESTAVSPKGARGLMQLMPDTARAYGVSDFFDPEQNIEGGTKYLKDLIKLYGGKTGLVLAAYNAGQEAVKKYKGIPPYPETREYIKRIQAGYKNASIRTRTVIYKYYDADGKLVLTNDPRLYALHKGGGPAA